MYTVFKARSKKSLRAGTRSKKFKLSGDLVNHRDRQIAMSVDEENGDEGELLVITTGGTIDKDYPTKDGYAFVFSEESAAERIIESLPLSGLHTVRYAEACKKDSTDMDDDDAKRIFALAFNARVRRIVVTHGTDTMIDTANRIHNALRQPEGTKKTVVFTGALKPEHFKDSDAAFNLGGAIAATGCLPPGSVAICMGGMVIPAPLAERCPDTGRFQRVSEYKVKSLNR